MTYIFTAVIECPDLQLPRHSLADQTTGQYSDTITVYCRKGYWFRKGVTSVLVTCQVDGTWDIELEQCSGENLMVNYIIYFQK